jgi:hypothetical protein
VSVPEAMMIFQELSHRGWKCKWSTNGSTESRPTVQLAWLAPRPGAWPILTRAAETKADACLLAAEYFDRNIL